MPGRKGLSLLNGLEALLVCVTCLHVFLVPYTGSEELWYHQTIYDLLRLDFRDKAQFSQYNHFTFPELQTVPRSFIGPALIACFSSPFRYLAAWLGLQTFFVEQISIRLVLATYNASSLVYLARRAQTVLGARVSNHFLLISIFQFHLPFWMGRAVPNMAAFGSTQVALAWIVFPSAHKMRRGAFRDVLSGLCLLATLAIILRLEIAGLLLPLALQALSSGTVNLGDGLFYGTVVSLGAIASTVLIDSFFWNKLLWPEMSQFIWNVLEGRSEQYGTLPFYTYTLVYLPKILLLAYPLVIYTMSTSPIARHIALPMLGQVLLMSFLRHKEWRFCCYVIPCLNLVAMKGLSDIRRRHKRTARCMVLVICSVSLFYTLGALYASSSNYTGGEAMFKLDTILRQEAVHRPEVTRPTVNIDWYACVNGALDSQLEPNLALVTKRNTTMNIEHFEYRITHEPHLYEQEYEILEVIGGWAGITAHLSGWQLDARDPGERLQAFLRTPPIKPQWQEKVWIMGRKERFSKARMKSAAGGHPRRDEL